MNAAQGQDLLRWVICGSVDDGKSTLIGRLLYDAGQVAEDHLVALAADSRRWGTQGDALDFALLVDGLTAEREQGITIDVAYRYFETPARKFIVADTPGHEQYTRNMVTGASNADLAVVLVDARKGVLTQTRRHTFLAHLLGVRQVILAVNKMDLLAQAQARFAEIVADFRSFAQGLEGLSLTAIPVSGTRGDHVVHAGAAMPWYSGPTLMQALERAPLVQDTQRNGPLRFPVQWVNRPHQDFRGYCGWVSRGEARCGDRVRVMPGGHMSRIERIVRYEGDSESAITGESVTLVLADAVDVSRGDLIVSADDPAQLADQFECTLVWMHEEPLLPGRQYAVKLHNRWVLGTITALKHRIDIQNFQPLAAKTLACNEIGVANLSLSQAVPFEPYSENRETGGLIIVDRNSQQTVAAGMLHFALRRASNIHHHAPSIDQKARAALMRQTPRVIWFTGLSGSGKSTLANALALALHREGRHVYVLDGDNLRHGLNRDLGFTDADRVENIRRVAEVAKLMVDAGLIVLTAFISPFRAERAMARALFAPGEFVEVFVDVPLSVAEQRDPKGLYAKARRGELPNFTGIDAPYEAPFAPELTLRTDQIDLNEAVLRLRESSHLATDSRATL